MLAVFDGLDLVVQKIALAAALELAQHRLADHPLAFIAHKGFDRQAPLGGGGDHAQFAQAFQGHAQGARDGRGGEGEHIDLGAQGLHGLFVAHAKAVFFVNHQQTQVFVLDRFAQQLVRADHDVHAAVGQADQGGVDFFGRAKAADLGHLHRPLGKAVAQGLKVLLSEQGGGRQKRHLLAARDGDKGGAQSHLGFAKTHIAADQAVHRARADHVLDHRMDGRALIGGFFKTKVVGKHLVVGRAVAKCVTGACRTAGVNVEQLGGHVADLLGRFAPRFVPLA